MIRVSGQSKSRPVKAAGAEVGAQRRNQKLHAAVAKRRFGSENVQNTSAPKRFLLSWCQKIARRCGEKHIMKSKCTKHLMVGALLEVLMRKNCTNLWRKAHLQVKMYKTRQLRSAFCCPDVKKLHAAVAKSTFWSEHVKKLRVWEHFFEVLMSQNCTRLWRKANFEVKMYKTRQQRTVFGSSDVEKSVR